MKERFVKLLRITFQAIRRKKEQIKTSKKRNMKNGLLFQRQFSITTSPKAHQKALEIPKNPSRRVLKPPEASFLPHIFGDHAVVEFYDSSGFFGHIFVVCDQHDGFSAVVHGMKELHYFG